MKERLQKILARAGVASRRAAEALIVSGRVRVNGRIVTELGVTADPRHDRVDVDGKRVVREPLVYVLYHKPRGMVATMKDPEGRPAVGEVVEKIGVRVVPVGRLDFHTSGALLLTNDGELTDALLHPKREVPKVYVAKLRGSLDVKELDLLRNGVVLDDGEKTRPANVFVIREESGSTWIEITLYEGRNRQIHRMGDAIGHAVLRLARLSFAGITTEGLRPGQWRPLDARELERLVRDWVTPRRESDANDARVLRAGGRPPPTRHDADDTIDERPVRLPGAGSARVPTRGGGVGSMRGPAGGAGGGVARGAGRERAEGSGAGVASRGPARGPGSSASNEWSRGSPRDADGEPSRSPGRGVSSEWARGSEGDARGESSRGPGRGGESSRGPGRGESSRGPGRGGESSRGPGRGGDSSRGPGRGESSRGPGRGGESSRGPGRSGESSRGPGRGGESSRGPGRGGESSRGPGRGGNSSRGPGRGGESSRGPGRGEKTTAPRGPARGAPAGGPKGEAPRGASRSVRDEHASRVDRPRRGR